jgi:hypothetical protein
MGWFKRWYGANPLHMLAMIGCFALAWYAGAGLLHAKPVGVAVWFAGAVVGHDLILMPLYALADKSVMTVFRHRPPKLPTVPWINYLRVPVVLSGMLLLIWFPLIFRIPSRFPRYTDLSLDPYLGHWLTVTGALFLLSAIALAVRLRPGRGGRAEAGHADEFAGLPPHLAPGYPEPGRYPDQPRYPEGPRYPEEPSSYPEWPENPGQPRYPERPRYPGQPRYPERPRYRERPPYPEQAPYPQPRFPERPRYPQQPRSSEQPRYPQQPRPARNEPNSAPPPWDSAPPPWERGE